MNKLQAFIESYGSGRLAVALGVSKGTVSSWRSGRFKMSPQNARKIAEISSGAVTVHDLRPDIFGPAVGEPVPMLEQGDAALTVDRRRTDRRRTDWGQPNPAAPDEGQAA